MDIKLDVNKLVDKLANAERTVGELGDRNGLFETAIKNQLQEIENLKAFVEKLNKKCDELQSNSDFWYKKACELGYEYKPMTNPENEDFAHGA